MSSAIPSPAARPVDRAVLAHCFFLGALAFFLVTVRIGWINSIVEDNGFRQTQTGISIYYMIDHFPQLAYETPVVGPPWSIPYEFPLYQWLVAGLVTVLHTRLEPTGRFISVAFYLLCLIPADRVLAQLRFARRHRLLILALLLVSPYYIYWSRSFLIESTALFFGLAYLAVAMRYLETRGPWWAASAMATGSLAALVKVTTFGPCFLAFVLYWAYGWLKQYRERPFRAFLVGRTFEMGVLALVPVALLWVWTHFADGQKEMNRIGHFMTSAALHDWNFGTLQQRLSLEAWQPIWQRYGLMLGHFAWALVCVPALLVARRRWEVLACAVVALSGPLLFINLYYQHEHYPYATGVFFIATVGVALVALMERGGIYRLASRGLLLGIVVLSINQYFHDFYPRQKTRESEHWIQPMAKVIWQETQPEDVLLILGLDWSPELPYYSRRRALMIPGWYQERFIQDYPNQLAELKRQGYRIGALVVSASARNGLKPEDLQGMIACLDLCPAGQNVHDHFVDIYARAGDKLSHRGTALPEAHRDIAE